jgi:iron complex outermembrane receptor protein
MSLSITKANSSMDMMEDVFNMNMETLQRIEVQSASKSSQLISETPATMLIVTQDQIKKRGYLNLLDLLEDVSGFLVYRFANAGLYSTISIRGITGEEYLKILRDGIEIDATKSSGSSMGTNIPLIGVNRVEIMYGGSSVVYGGDAISGVINLITDTKLGSVVEIKSYDGFFHFGTKYTGKLNNNTFTVGASYHQDNEYDFDKLYPDLYPKKDVILNGQIIEKGSERDFEYMPERTQSAFLLIDNPIWSFGANYSKTYDSTFISLTGNSATKELAYYDSNMIHELRGAYFKYRTELFDRIKFSSTLSYDATELDPTSFYINTYGNYQKAYKTYISERTALDETVRLTIFNNHEITAGLTFEHYYSMPKSFDLKIPYLDKSATYPGSDIPVEYYQYSWDNIAMFLQDQIKINSNWIISFANRISITNGNSENRIYRIALINQTDSLTQKFIHSKSFLMPGANSKYLHYGYIFLPNDKTREWDQNKYQINLARIPNENLESEWAESYEYNILSVIDKNMYIYLSIYYTKLSNMIRDQIVKNVTNSIPDTTVINAKQMFNNSWAEFYGTDLGAMYKKSFKNIDIDSWINYTHIDSHEIINRKKSELPYLKPDQIKAGSTISWQDFDFTLSGIWTDLMNSGYTDPFNPYTKKKISGNLIGDFFMNYNYKDNIYFSLSIKNIGDVRYYSPRISSSSDYKSPQEARKIILGLSYAF